jgi:ferredoxin
MPFIYKVTLVLPNKKKVVLEVRDNAFILDAAFSEGLELPHTCLQGWCVSCACRVVDGPATCVDNSAALRYYPEDQEGGFVLLCTARPRHDCSLVTHQSQIMKAFRHKLGLPAPGG